MSESDNLFEAPGSKVVGDNFIVHRPLINLVAAMVSWGFASFGMLFIIAGLFAIKSSIDNRGGWEVVLNSKAGLFQIYLFVSSLISTGLFLAAGYSFFRVNDSRGMIRFVSALAIGPVATLTLLFLGFRG